MLYTQYCVIKFDYEKKTNIQIDCVLWFFSNFDKNTFKLRVIVRLGLSWFIKFFELFECAFKQYD